MKLQKRIVTIYMFLLFFNNLVNIRAFWRRFKGAKSTFGPTE